jgi:hypothetical protein
MWDQFLKSKPMNKFYIPLIVLSGIMSISNAQTPDWLWATDAGGTDLDMAYSVAVDDSGNPYVAGYFESSTITFGSYTLTNAGGRDIFLVKYDSNGNVLWATSAGGTDNEKAKSVAVDASGNPYVAGFFESPTITFGPYTLTNVVNYYEDMFLAKYDANGNVLWAASAGGIDIDAAYSVAVDTSGNPYVAGFFRSTTITFGSYTLTNTGGGDGFLAKYDADGNVLWATSAGGTDIDGANSVLADASGNPYVAGCFLSPSITFGSYTLTNVMNYYEDMFLAKYDANGNVLWAASAGGTYRDFANSVMVDASGNPYVAGFFRSPTITFDSYTLTNAGGGDVFLVKYNANGDVLWATSAGGTDLDMASSVAVDASRNPYVAGLFGSPTITFGSYTLTNAGVGDMFLAKYDTDGDVLWAKSAGGTDLDMSYSVAVDDSGNPYVAGYFESSTITFGSCTLSNVGSYDILLAKLESDVGINDVNNSVNISVCPNPASTTIAISTPAKPNKNTFLIIYNINGQQLIKRQITEQQTVVNVSGLPQGVYFVRVSNDSAVKVGKFVVQ